MYHLVSCLQADQAKIKALEKELKESPKGGAGRGSSVEDVSDWTNI